MKQDIELSALAAKQHLMEAIRLVGVVVRDVGGEEQVDALKHLALALENTHALHGLATAVEHISEQRGQERDRLKAEREIQSGTTSGPGRGGRMHITPDDVVMVPAGALLDYFFECGSSPGSSISVGEHICWSELGFQADVLNLVRSYRQLAGRLPAAELLDASPDRIVAALAKRADGVRVLTAELQKVEGGAA